MRGLSLSESQVAPAYELRVRTQGAMATEMEVWQIPSPATPQLKVERRVAGLWGRNLELTEHRLLRKFKSTGIDTTGLKLGEVRVFTLEEDLALRIGLLFRVLAPMRSRDNMKACGDGIEAMGKEEAAYWLGMAMHRKNPRRVLSALRMLLTDPHR